MASVLSARSHELPAIPNRWPYSMASKTASPWSEVLSLMPVGVVLLSASGRVVEANPVAIDLLGVPLLGEHWRDVIDRAFDPQADDGHEVSLRDGRKVQLTTKALTSGEGQLVTLTDLTETRALQKRFSQRERLAGIGQVMASLAHQLRTPIASSLLNLHQLQRQLPAEADAKHARRLQDRLRYMERQITDMLLVAGGGQLRVEPIAVSELIQRVQDLCAPLFMGQPVRFEIHNDSDDSVIGHRDALIGALANLVENALQACLENRNGSDRCVQMIVSSVKTRVVFEVTDNGAGMNAQVLERLQEPFFSTKKTGTGLGLAVVHAVCESHQADLDVSSEPGQGSSFRMMLPRVSRAVLRKAV